MKIRDKIEKVVVNAGIGKIATNTAVGFKDKVLPELIANLSAITGQKPATRIAKNSIAGFKLREGTVVGLKVTLRGKRMENFLNKINQIVFPRLRDFKGINLDNIDKNGNLSIGLRDYLVFPEINQETLKTNTGLQITIVPKIKNRDDMVDFYRKIGIPLQK